jgi:hypothetical protein
MSACADIATLDQLSHSGYEAVFQANKLLRPFAHDIFVCQMLFDAI